MSIAVRLLPLLWLICLAACQVSNKPDLARLYHPIGTDNSNTPLILIHGSLGSKLRSVDTQEEVWPGNIKDLIFSNYKVLANRIIAEGSAVDYSIIESYAIFDTFSGLSIYDDVIDTLIEYGGYQLADGKQHSTTKRTLYLFHYDWRQDNVHNAQKLATFIERVLSEQPEQQQVDVVAHSLGGLILRYYQRFGGQDVLPGLINQATSAEPQLPVDSHANNIRHAIFLGTPQLGTVKAIERLRSGFDFNLRNIPVEVQVTMPSVYQLLPHPWSFWAADRAGQTTEFDLYNPELWRQNQWSIYDPDVIDRIMATAESPTQGQQQIELLQLFFNLQLKRAEAFWLSLSPIFEVEHEGFIVMGGSCKETLNRLIVDTDQTNGTLRLQHQINRNLGGAVDSQRSILFEPGDGQVSKSSLLGQIHNQNTGETLQTMHVKYPVFVCEDHLKLTENITFQDNLLHVLLND